MIDRPPATLAPPLLDLDFTDRGGLVLISSGPGTVASQPFSEAVLRDCILDAEVGLLEGEEEDRSGLFFRQTAPERYVACTINGAGNLSLGLVDGGEPLVVASAQLDGQLYRTGTGVTNRLTLVLCGPIIAVMVNGVGITGAPVDARYAAGRAGAFLVHTSSAPHVKLLTRWAQARPIIPPDS